MPNNCAVYNCYSRYSNREKNSFFHFPKNEELRAKWIDLCRRGDKFNANVARICSLHFESTAFERNLKYELLGRPIPKGQIRFKEGAVPTLNLPISEDDLIDEERRIKRYKEKRDRSTNQKKQRKRKVFRKMENLFVIDGIDLSASKESDVCDKETQCSNEEGEAFIGASVFIKEESMDHEEGSESSFGNEDWNICDGLQIKREVCIKEEDI
ncbi:uncharacterized protein LOC122260280 [Penaeus japonicus]|uniref:uncharacterized protein LOC122260280 n=1 Tax=Penaeus japonicus TaxID=27405 RepID=UPI001C71297F|nr:uncharacterized protein LOC122260280 [Penaeus japonicus]